MSEKFPIPSPELLDETLQITLHELATRCAVETEIVITMVQEGVLSPRGESEEQWCFSGQDIIRLHRALRMQRDLEVNLPGAALALDLLEELDELRARLEQIERRLLR